MTLCCYVVVVVFILFSGRAGQAGVFRSYALFTSEYFRAKILNRFEIIRPRNELILTLLGRLCSLLCDHFL